MRAAAPAACFALCGTAGCQSASRRLRAERCARRAMASWKLNPLRTTSLGGSRTRRTNMNPILSNFHIQTRVVTCTTGRRMTVDGAWNHPPMDTPSLALRPRVGARSGGGGLIPLLSLHRCARICRTFVLHSGFSRGHNEVVCMSHHVLFQVNRWLWLFFVFVLLAQACVSGVVN